ncbi:MAG: hypothetical protein FWC50_13800 [Planctomycetaceae bacterium]|nr:hypothetical protein [Planctomycetaceae bacterium]
MVYETKYTRMTPAADFSMESMEQQIQRKFELEQVEQYLNETFPKETELKGMNPEMAIEALGGEFFYDVWKKQEKAEKKSESPKTTQENKKE